MRKATFIFLVLGIYFGSCKAFAQGIDENTKLLLHNDDASFSDSSPSAHPVTNSGAVQLDTVNKVFGAGSAEFVGGTPGEGGQYKSGGYLGVADSNDWNFGNDDFTIDLLFNIQDNVRFPIMHQATDSNNFWRLEWDQAAPGGSKLAFEVRDAGTFTLLQRPDWSPTFDTWYHLAEVRSDDTWYMFVDGVLLDSMTSAVSIPDFTGDLNIGRVMLLDGSYTYTNGNLDEIRISKGIARWTSDFTPPTEPYSTVVPEPSTLFLLGTGLLGLVLRRRLF